MMYVVYVVCVSRGGGGGGGGEMTDGTVSRKQDW